MSRNLPKPQGRLPQVRMSVLDPNLRGEPWFSTCAYPGLLVMYLNNQPVTTLPGTPLDQAALNQVLFNLRHRYPRKWPRSA